MDVAIRTEHLSRVYTTRDKARRRIVALEDVNIEVQTGELFGVLGPNGAGKTTLIKILTTLLTPTSGRAWVLGYDVEREYRAIRPHINMVSGGETSGYGLLTVWENLWMFAQFYGLPWDVTRERIHALAQRIGLEDRLRTKVSELSTGLRQKANLIRGFLTDPQVLFLDEPTLGLDVQAARDVREFIKEWMTTHPNRTIVLTTHYMPEAEELCDRVAIIHKGRIIACDTPARLKQRVQKATIFRLEVTRRNGLSTVPLQALPGVQRVWMRETPQGARLDLYLDADDALMHVLQALTAQGARILSLEKRVPSLEDVFLHLVGEAWEAEGDAAKAALG